MATFRDVFAFWVFLTLSSWNKVALSAGEPPVKMTVLLPFTSVYRDIGDAVRDGFLLGVEKQSKILGIDSKTLLDVQFVDSKADVPTARDLVKAAIGNGAKIIGGVVSSDVAMAVQSEAQASKVPLIIFGAAGTPKVRSDSGRFLRLTFSNYQPPYGLAAWLRNQGPYSKSSVKKKYACIHADYQAGIDYCDGFKMGFGDAGTEIGRVPVPFRTVDKSPFLVQLKGLKPDFAYAFFAGSDAEIFLTEYYKFQLHKNIPLTVTGDVFAPKLLEAYNQTAKQFSTGDGVYFSSHWAPSLENMANKEFLQAFREKYQRDPSHFALHGYDGGRLVIDGLNKNRMPESLINTMRHADIPSPRHGKPIRFDSGGDPINPQYIFLTRIENGKIKINQVGTIESLDFDDILKNKGSTAH